MPVNLSGFASQYEAIETAYQIPAGSTVLIADANPARFSLTICNTGGTTVLLTTNADNPGYSGITLQPDGVISIKLSENPMLQAAAWYAVTAALPTTITVFRCNQLASSLRTD